MKLLMIFFGLAMLTISCGDSAELIAAKKVNTRSEAVNENVEADRPATAVIPVAIGGIEAAVTQQPIAGVGIEAAAEQQPTADWLGSYGYAGIILN